MKLVISAWWFPVGVPVYLARAARRLGHEVVTVGPSACDAFWKDGDPAFRESWERHAVTPDVPAIESQAGHTAAWEDPAVVERVRGADLWLDVDGGWLLDGYLPEHLVKRRVYVCTDPHVESEAWRAREFINTPRPAGTAPVDAVYMMQYAQCRPEAGEFWMPYAFDPEWHRPFNDVEMDHDVTIIGAMYEGRCLLAEHLTRHGLRVLGPGRGPVAEDYSRQLCRAPVAIVWPLSNDVPARLFEALACRRRVVMLHKPGMGLMELPSWPWPRASQHVWTTNTMNGALARVRSALSYRAHESDMASRGLSVALTEHTWDFRLASLIAEQCP